MLNDDTTSEDFQSMTKLPEDLERKLLDVPMAILLVQCGLLGASTKYTCVQKLALKLTEKELRKIADHRYKQIEINEAMDKLQRNVRRANESGLPTKAAPVKGISRSRAPRQPILSSTRIRKLQGETKIQPGSLRDKVLQALDGELTVEQLGKKFNPMFDVKPILAKLREAGWVELS